MAKEKNTTIFISLKINKKSQINILAFFDMIFFKINLIIRRMTFCFPVRLFVAIAAQCNE